MCCAELLGPVRFSHWDDSGNPVGKPVPKALIQIAAISESQTNNTYDVVMDMLNGGLAFQAYDLDGCVMLSKVVTRTGRKIEKVTSSPRGREGQRVTFVVCDETHLWVPAEKGPELMEALKRNAEKKNNRIVETTNAFVPGEGSAAEISHNSVEEMLRRLDEAGIDGYPKTLFDSRQVFVEDIYNWEEAYPALQYVYGDSAIENGGFVDLERIWESINDPASREHVSRRFWFNQHILGHSTWLRPNDRKASFDPKLKLKKTDKIALGFKITPSKGCVIAAVRLIDGAIFNLSLKGWERPEHLRPEDKWEVSAAEVDKRMRKIIDTYDVYKVVADRQSFQDIIGRWYETYGDVIEEAQVSNKTKMAGYVEQFESAVQGRRIRWTDDLIDRHISNCHIEEVPAGVVIRQETKGTKRYIIGAQAAVLALEAGVIAIEEGALKQKTGTLYSF